MTFFEQDYKIPQAPSSYMKLRQGKNRFRILDKAIFGWQYWNTDNKPVRSRKQFDLIPNDIKVKDDGMPSEIKHFWAFPVWNYDLGMVQILELTQKSIMGEMKDKIDNREGNATENDFVITRSGTGFDTEYKVDVLDRSPIPTDATVTYRNMNLNLEALFDGADPFNSKTASNSSPEAQNSGSGFQKFAEAANRLTPQNKASQGQISPDIQEAAAKLEDGYDGNPFDDDQPPF